MISFLSHYERTKEIQLESIMSMRIKNFFFILLKLTFVFVFFFGFLLCYFCMHVKQSKSNKAHHHDCWRRHLSNMRVFDVSHLSSQQRRRKQGKNYSLFYIHSIFSPQTRRDNFFFFPTQCESSKVEPTNKIKHIESEASYHHRIVISS